VTGSSVDAGRALNLVIGLVVIVLTIRVGTTLANRRAGLLAGLVLAVYPPLVVNDVVLLSEPLSLLLLLSLVLALAARRPALAGVATGLLVLTKPSAQAVALIVAIWILWQLGWRRMVRFGVVVALVVAPWIVRNWLQVGSPVLVTSNGFNLAAIYSPQARARGSFVDPVYDPSFSGYRLAQFDEVGWQRTLQHLAVQSIEHHPSQVAGVVARNSAAYFELKPSFNRLPEIEDGRNLDVRRWGLGLYYLVTAWGLVGIALVWREPLTKLLVAIVTYFVLASVLVVAPPRLRAPFDLMCCIGAGIAIDRVVRRWRARAQVSA
jgi:4-amino-4-deoxy-L-arabinose transferase-like glycosyltransferase